MRPAGTINLLILTCCFTLFLALPSSHGDEEWRKNFDDTCSKTAIAMSLAVAEINSLIENCTRLKIIIEGQDDTVKRVYLKRLEMCKNLYIYVLGEKMKEQQGK